jgi:tetratricopeptide (TPR) repeat protein
MNRLIQFLAVLLIYGSMPFGHAQNPVPAPVPQQAAADKGTDAASGQDIYRPPVETAIIQGVSPGISSAEQLTEHWGEPLQENTVGDQTVRHYSMEPLNHIEVTLRTGIVRSIVIHLDTPFPEEEVRSSLYSELLRSKPVLIPDEAGGILGEVFPEKGVMFLFAPQHEGRGHLVRQIGIEPISADPFVLRAEAVLYDQPAEAKRDLRDAVRLKSEHAKAHWLLAQIELQAGYLESAIVYAEKAIQLDEQKPAYHLTFVQAMIQMNRIEEAKQYLQETIGICDRFPHEKAKALMMLGELYRTSRKPDHELAHACHEEAIKLASALVKHNNPTIRLTAKDVLFEAHLATAKAIAWGDWDKRDEAITKWIDRAKLLARDPELLAARRYSREYPFKIAACALATLVAVPEQLSIDVYIEDVVDAGNELIKTTNDPILRAKHHWDTSLSLYDAVQIFQLRQQYSAALKYGELATNYMEVGIKGRNSDTDWFLLGRLYFRLGAIHAIGNQNHRAAIEWYDLAKPVVERLLPKIDTEALGLFGEMLVSMGVSYWETDQRDEAVRLTEKGLRQLERGVRDRVIEAPVLVTPYSNLAKMYDSLGKQEDATKYRRLAVSHQSASAKKNPIN